LALVWHHMKMTGQVDLDGEHISLAAIGLHAMGRYYQYTGGTDHDLIAATAPLARAAVENTGSGDFGVAVPGGGVARSDAALRRPQSSLGADLHSGRAAWIPLR